MKKYLFNIAVFVLLASPVFYGCKPELPDYSAYPPEVREALALAGDNISELTHVMQYYQEAEDSLKLKAAYFLIANMPGKYSQFYDAPWNDIAAVSLRWSSSSDKQKVLREYNLGFPVRQDDLTHITADYLINNIELSFRVWEQTPWGKDVPFDIFCEFILPYRLDSEPLENWREKALASFADVYDSFLKNDTLSSVDACIQLNRLLPRFRMDKDFSVMNFSQLMASSRGTCESMGALAVFSMRALGIPVTRDYTIQWPNKPASGGHSWNSVYDGKGGMFLLWALKRIPARCTTA